MKAERGRIQMLESAARCRAQMQNKCVIVIRNFAEHANFGFDNLLHFALQSQGIVVAFAVDDDAMRDAVDAEIKLSKIADFHRRVVKNIEILGAKRVLLARQRRQTGGDFPTRWHYY